MFINFFEISKGQRRMRVTLVGLGEKIKKNNKKSSLALKHRTNLHSADCSFLLRGLPLCPLPPAPTPPKAHQSPLPTTPTLQFHGRVNPLCCGEDGRIPCEEELAKEKEAKEQLEEAISKSGL
jgi:hypothetical protein